jgi:anti-sigma factor RsiW
MTEKVCSHPGDRDERLIAYLYDDESDASSRAEFEAHLASCARCTDDLAALQGVRTQLSHWAPPEPKFAVANPKSRIPNPVSWWREIPAWAQVAAALLFLGVAAGIANLDVRYDTNGLSVRTGWRPPSRDARFGEPGPVAVPATTPGTNSQISAVATREELNALERRLKTEFHAAPVAATAVAGQTPTARAASDAEVVRRVRALVDESEKRQQRELALRLAEVLRDVNMQRQADLVKVDRALGLVKNDLGVEVLKNRQQMNYYMRTSQRQ